MAPAALGRIPHLRGHDLVRSLRAVRARGQGHADPGQRHYVVNLAILFYLLLAKRLFGLRGGAAADEAAREADSGWAAFEQLTPGELTE